MKIYSVMAFVTPINKYLVREIVAGDEDEAISLFIDTVCVEMNNSDLEFDDFSWKTTGFVPVFIDSNPYNGESGFVSDDLTTLTVGELIERLSKFDKEAKVYLRNENETWNVFKGLSLDDIEEGEIYN